MTEEEIAILTDFFERSIAIIDAATEKMHNLYPELFRKEKAK